MDGIIIINKEKQWTSNDIVQKLKGIFHEKVGHTGTLDPLATGVLPVLIGKGTLLSKYLINHDKEYIATINLGEKRSTGDSEGDIIEKKSVNNKMLQKENIENVLHSFLGKYMQTPPMYSAIKVNGKKLYEYARKGQDIEVKPREVEIYSIELVSVSQEKQEIKYRVSCSKGTYIRTLSEDIALKLGTVGYMKELQRTRVGDFCIEQAIKISDITKDSMNNFIKIEDFFKNNEENINHYFITIEKFFENRPKIKLDNIKLKNFLNGVKICNINEDGIYRIYNETSKFIGIGEIKNNTLKRDIVI